MPSPTQLDILAIAAPSRRRRTDLRRHSPCHARSRLDHRHPRSHPGRVRHPRHRKPTAKPKPPPQPASSTSPHREALDLPDGNVENTLANRLKLATVLRRLRPRVVILPYWQGRHPDHYTSATLGYEACFVSGLAKVNNARRSPPPPHRPYKILYASLYADVRPTFVVDITPFAEQRLQSLLGLPIAIWHAT